MKKLLCLLLVFYTANIQAKNYYISASGNDANNGLTATTSWKTITKLNASFNIISAGDSILFKCGDTFYGTITIAKTGTKTLPIVFSSYATGTAPVITGFTTITNWTNEGGGIYSKVITSAAQTNMVTIDDVQQAMGRFPDTAYKTYQTFSTNTSITDNQLGSSINWKGAEVVIRKNDWSIERCNITNHSGNTLSYTSTATTQNGVANFGYFIQNDLRTLTSYGEWYHNPATGKFYMFFGSVDPNAKNVKVATLNNLVYANGNYDYINLNNIAFTGSIDNMVNFQYGQDFCIVQNCNLSFAGGYGINILATSTNDIFDNNTIKYCNKSAVNASYSLNTIVSNNYITNIGSIVGQNLGTGTIDGLFIIGNGAMVKYNTIKNIGSCGIILKNVGAATLQYNTLDSVCTLLDDGGAIYTNNPDTSIRIIDHNIISNIIGNNDGTDNNVSVSVGIYLDENSSNVTVSNNFIVNSPFSGIKMHKAATNNIINNTTYNSKYGIGYEDWEGNNIRHNSMTGNIFFAKTAAQYPLYYRTVTNDIASFGTADSNYYTRPINDTLLFSLNQPSTKGTIFKPLDGWQGFTNQDLHSVKNTVKVTDINSIRYEFNASKVAKTIALDAVYTSVNGTNYNGSITLQPFTNAILMKTGTLDTAFKLNAGKDTILVTPVNSLQLAVLANKSVKKYQWSKFSGPFQWSIAHPNSANPDISNLGIGTFIFQVMAISVYGDTAISKVTVFTKQSDTYKVLPIQMLNISAVNENEKVTLQWQVTAESNIKNYIIERSANGKTFDSIGVVASNNLFAAISTYKLEDKSPLDGTDYYRVVTLDLDGSKSYSKTVLITVTNKNSFTILNVLLSSNNHSLKININSSIPQSVNVMVADVSGRIIFTAPLQLNTGFNSINSTINAINTGVYYIKLATKTLSLTKEVLSSY